MRGHGYWMCGVALGVAGLVRAEVPAAPARPERPIPAIKHVALITIDGLRPDRLLIANTPTLHGLLHDGAYTMWARTTPIAVTLPSFTSMLTGVTPRRHGIEWDRDMPFATPVYPKFPTVLGIATNAGYVTAMVAGKSKFATLNQPGTITHPFVPAAEKITDDEVAVRAVDFIEKFKPDLIFVHFPQVDTVGHAKGWGSPEQLAQIEAVDGDVAKVLAALERAGLRDSTLVIVSADHGGAGLTHGPDDPRSRHIPWIASGPGVRKFHDLTQDATLTVQTEDTCATICWVLGLPLPGYLDGKPVDAAFETAK